MFPTYMQFLPGILFVLFFFLLKKITIYSIILYRYLFRSVTCSYIFAEYSDSSTLTFFSKSFIVI